MDTQTPVIDMPQTLLAWSAPTHATFTRSARWYVIACVLAALCFLYGVFFQAWSISLLVLVIGGLYVLLRKTAPHTEQMVITTEGWTMGKRFTRWQDTAEFWLIRAPLYAELHIQRKKGWNHQIVIHNGPVDPMEIRSVLSRFIPENTEKHESFLDIFIRICKL